MSKFIEGGQVEGDGRSHPGGEQPSHRLVAGASALRDGEERFLAFMNQSPVVAWVKDEEFRFRYVNAAFEQLFKMPADSILGRTDYDVYTKEEADQTRANDRRVLEVGSIVQAVEVVAGADGRPRHWLVQKFPLNLAGGATWTGGTAVDVTARIEAEEALRHTEDRYRAIFNGAPDALFVIAVDGEEAGRIVAANEMAASSHGYEVGELVGKSITVVDAPDAARQMPERLRRLAAGERLIFEIEHVRKDGSQFPVEVTAERVMLDGRPHVLAFDRDLTQKRQAEQALRQSQERLSAVIKNTPYVAIQWFDAQGRVKLWNEASEVMFGFKAEEALGKTLDQLIHTPEETAAFRAVIAGISRTGRAIGPTEFAFRGRSGESGICLSSIFRIPGDAEGDWYVCMDVDITARKVAEKALHRQIAVLERIAAGDPLAKVFDAIVALVEGEVARSLCSILLLDGDRLRHGAGGSLPPDYSAAIDGLRIGPTVGSCGTAAFLSQTVIVSEIATNPLWDDFRELALSHGLRSCWSVPVIAGRTDGLPHQGGQVLGTFAVYRREPSTPTSRDLEVVNAAAHLVRIAMERVRAESERRRLEDQLQNSQKLESLGVLAGGIAHDFNNLLTPILGTAGLALAKLPLDSPVRPLLLDIERAAKRSAELTQQMLTYTGKASLDIRSFRLDELVREMADLLRSVVSKKAEIELDLKPATIKGDATQVRQVVMNLITNASDALEGQRGAIRIRTGRRIVSEKDVRSPLIPGPLPAGPYAFVEIEDTGCGMSEQTLARIFDPFFTTKFTGRGLGLASTLGIVRSHLGTIKVRSAPGQGTQFHILFPSAGDQATAEPDQGRAMATTTPTGTLLLIEDEPLVRGYLQLVLEGAGYNVLIGEDGERGLEVFATHHAKIIAVVLDLTMPRLDGIEVLRGLRTQSRTLPVLLVSGYSEQEVTSRCDKDAALDFIQKPFLPPELLAKLSGLLSAPCPGRP